MPGVEPNALLERTFILIRHVHPVSRSTSPSMPILTARLPVMSAKSANSAGVLSAFPQGNTTGNLQKLAQVIPMKITFAAPKNLTLIPGMNVTVRFTRTSTVAVANYR